MALLAAAFDALSGVQTELAIFFIALCTHTLLFGSHRFRPLQKKHRQSCSGKGLGADRAPKTAVQQPPAGSVALVRSIRQLLREGASCEVLRKEILSHLGNRSRHDAVHTLAFMLEGMGKNSSAEMLAAVRDALRERGFAVDQQLGELVLRGYLSLRLHSEFKKVLAEVEAMEVTTPSIAVLALRSSMSCNDLAGAMDYLHRFASPLKASLSATPSAMPQQFIRQLLQLATQQAVLPNLLRGLAGCGLLTPWVMETALVESAPRATKDSPSFLKELEELASAEGVELTDAALAVLVRSAEAPENSRRLIAKAAHRGSLGKELLLAALEVAAAHGSKDLVKDVTQLLPKSPPPEVATMLLRSTAMGLSGRELGAAMLRTYEQHLTDVDILVDTRVARLVAEAAFQHRRPELLQQMLRTTLEPSRRVSLLKSFSSEQRLADATAVFHACPDQSVCLYNALLDACIDCQDMEAAERIMAEAVAADMADVVTYNTMIKKHLQRGDIERARSVIETMRLAGGSLAPNSVTFNELIDATVRNDIDGAWVLIEEMKACGLQPTSVTCSILLKSIQRTSKPADVERAVAFVDQLDSGMDEVLLSSVCEACVRANRSDLVARQLQRHRGKGGLQVNGAHTFGSIIRAYGFLKDLQGAWETWLDMRGRQILPTSITIGCMVEALVLNGDPEAGYELIQELARDEQTQSLLNAIVYCSVLKGFCHQKSFSRVWAVYDEMIKMKLQFSIVTYNALIDACARGCEMSRVPSLLEDMACEKIEPNLVTYSTILKGYCQEGHLDKAFELLGAMRQSEHFKPDEIAYNTIIDGCAQRGLYDQGMRVLEEMQQAGVAPSTFTLSVVVKLANRGRRPERAFELVEDISRKYHLRLNIHVYDNLVHACTAHGDMPRALQVLERMVRQRVRPDLRTFTLLLRGCIEAGELPEAAGLVRMACGLRCNWLPQRLSGLTGLDTSLKGGLPAALITEVLEGMMSKGEERAAVQLCKDLRAVPGLKLDPKVSMSLTSRAIRA